jgi:glycerol-3-phosphate dehydrogenase (NAD(P)+)
MPEWTVAVFGAGTWGATLACLLRAKGAAVALWEFAPAVVEALARTRRPAKLPYLELPADVLVTGDLDAAPLREARHWVVAVPSHGVRALAARLAPRWKASPPETIAVCAKGIEPDTGLTMGRVIESELGPGGRGRVAALSGPSHAEEVARHLPTTIVAASEDAALARRVQELFNTPRFRVYTNDDPLGVELGGALKNVVAIAAGVCDGMGLGDNARAALLTRGLAEMTRLGAKMGARAETFAGLTGMGDLIATATSRHSRNRNFGELLGRGMKAEEARAQIGMEVEGVYAARSARRLAEREKVEMPIAAEVHAILYENKTPAQAVQDLLSRDPKPEVYA